MSLFSRATVSRLGLALALVSGGDFVHAAREVIENKTLFDYRLYGQTQVVTFDETPSAPDSFPITLDPDDRDAVDFGPFRVLATGHSLSWQDFGTGGTHDWKLIWQSPNARGSSLFIFPKPSTEVVPRQVAGVGFEYTKLLAADIDHPLQTIPYIHPDPDPKPAFETAVPHFDLQSGFASFVVPDEGLALVVISSEGIEGQVALDNIVVANAFASFAANSTSPYALDADNQWAFTGPLPAAVQTTAETTAAYSIEQTSSTGQKSTAHFAVPGRDGVLDLLDYRFPRGAMNIKFELAAPSADRLPYSWYPMHVGDVRAPIVTSPRDKKCKGLPVLVTMESGSRSSQLSVCANVNSTVQGREIVPLPTVPFGSGAKVAAYRVNTLLSAKGQTFSLYNWFVPGLGPVVQGNSALLSKASVLSGFTFTDPDDGVTIYSASSDSDGDGIPYWKEVAVLHTSPKSDDTDQDTVLDGADNCPRLKNGPGDNEDQLDSDEDGVGDACETVQTGKVKKGMLTDNSAAGTDSATVTLIGCEGLADAMVALPAGNSIENVKVTIGEKTYGPIAWPNPVAKKGAYPVVFASHATTAKPIGTITLTPGSDTLAISGKSLDFAFDAEHTVKVELGGWACQADTVLVWSPKSNVRGTVYKAPPLPR